MAQTGQTIDVAQLIENRKISTLQFVVIAWACAIMFIEGYDMQVVPFAAPAMIKAWHVNKAYFGPVFGFGLFGYMLGATLLSNLGDKFGRKKVIVSGGLLFGAFTLASAFSATLRELLVLRFIAGIGLGASIPARSRWPRNMRRRARGRRPSASFSLATILARPPEVCSRHTTSRSSAGRWFSTWAALCRFC